jgi:hypothetical protein
MKSSATEIIPILGTAMGGGFYAGRTQIGDQVFALIVAPKALGELVGAWNDSLKSVAGAISYCDGLENTIAMVEAGSAIAQAARALVIDGAQDWYIPSQDELEVIYRNLKPTTETNSCYARSGINLSAVPPTRPYTPDLPMQTLAETFQVGGAEAFEEAWYWSSTQHAAYSDYAWLQYFYHGGQGYDHKSYQGRARAVRRLPI